MESEDVKGQANWLHDAKTAYTLSCWSRQGCLINITCAHGNKQAELAWLLLQPDNASSHSNNINLPVHCWLMRVQLNGAAFLHWKIAWVMEAQPMTENRAYIVNNHIITCTISKHNHACCFACFDSNDSIIFPLLWKWQIPQPMRPRFAISPSEVLHNEPCYRWWEARQLELVRTTNNWNSRTAFWTTSDFPCWLL